MAFIRAAVFFSPKCDVGLESGCPFFNITLNLETSMKYNPKKKKRDSLLLLI